MGWVLKDSRLRNPFFVSEQKGIFCCLVYDENDSSHSRMLVEKFET